MRHLLLLPALILSGATLPAQTPQTAGQWEGAIDLPGAKLIVVIDLVSTKEGWTGKISIPQQGGKDLPLEKIMVTGRSVSFGMAGVPGNPTFKGEVNAEGTAVAGQFTQSGQSFPFKLAKDVKAAAY